MSKEDYAKSPLLYVEQSGISEPRARMQKQYRSYGKSTLAHKEQQTDAPPTQSKTEPRSKRRSPLRQSPLAQEPEEPENQASTDDRENKQPDQQPSETSKTTQEEKPFKDMTVEEKIVHLTNRSSHAPMLRCEVKTAERSYRGVMTESRDNQVFMQVGRRTSTTAILTADIQDIRLLGLM